MHISPGEDNFKKGGTAVKPLIIEDCKTHMGYVDEMEHRYSIGNITWK
jgi:hypothetical protein